MTPLPSDMPNRMKQLRRDDAGRPVPFFVEYVNGKPDFRVMNRDHFALAVMQDLCWVCGKKLTKHQSQPIGTFVAGPMCLVNHVSAEPPAHADCAEWSAKACPFLNNPNKVRREGNLPDGWTEAPGEMILRNPGVTALIESTSWKAFKIDQGVLFRFSQIRNVTWYREGREATTVEVLDSMETGMPALMEAAEADGELAVRQLQRLTVEALKWVPQTTDDL